MQTNAVSGKLASKIKPPAEIFSARPVNILYQQGDLGINSGDINGLAHDCSYSIANALDSLQSCDKSLIWYHSQVNTLRPSDAYKCQ